MKKLSVVIIKKKPFILGIVFFAGALILAAGIMGGAARPAVSQTGGGYVILGSNDLGMHCYPIDFSSFLIISPGNTLRVQVFQKGENEAKLVTDGIKVQYAIRNNTFSAGKTNFWEYAKDYGYDVPKNIGITGNGLSGEMKLSADKRYFEATMIPVTPYNDGSSERNPYQLALVTVKDTKTGKVLATADNIVLPVSDEMLCSTCHGAEQTETNILSAHDELSGTTLAADLKNGKRYKCGDCHRDSALELAGKQGVLPLSQAMHGFHASRMEASNISPACYSCHPGPETQCYRGYMSMAGIVCGSAACHGDMETLAETQASGREGWLEEPDCAQCHGDKYGANKDTLYKDSTLMNAPCPGMNGIISCESCHNSAHAIWVSSNSADNLLPESILGRAGFIDRCTVCHQGEGRIHN